MGQVDEIFLGYDLYDPQLEIDLSVSICRWINNRDYTKLFFYLYRIDVNEELVRQILDGHELDQEKSLKIAKLMIQRQLKKLENRS